MQNKKVKSKLKVIVKNVEQIKMVKVNSRSNSSW